MKHSKTILFFLGCMILVFGIAATEANTAPSTPSHCYALLSPVDGKSENSSHVLEAACFDTFAKAMEAATKGRVHLDPTVRPENVTNEELNNVDGTDLPATQVVIGIDWDYANYGGSSYTWVVADNGCTDTIQYSVSSMPSGWNDRVSSSRAYSNCNYYYHYQNTNFSGSYNVCNTDCPGMGSLDNA